MNETTGVLGQLASRVTTVTDAQPPVWVDEWLDAAPLERVPIRHESIEVRVACGAGFSRVEAAFAGVRAMDILTFQQTIAETYRAVFDQLAGLNTPYPVRFWSFIPDIHAAMGAGLDRYMAFNAGRFAAYSAWCGGRDAFGQALATASAVGVTGERLVLNCLASTRPGTPVENPRQVPAYRYSKRFGPLPPCFARATRLTRGSTGAAILLVGGTASICGEDSLHVGQLEAQALETFDNLASVVSRACGEDGEAAGGTVLDWLDRFRELRIYRPREQDTDAVVSLVEEHFPALRRIELLRAELCRAELLVEIEGLAEI